MSGCTTAGTTTTENVVASTTLAYPTLPDTIITIPSGASGFAEASGTYSMAASVPPADPAPETAAVQPAADNPILASIEPQDASTASIMPASFAGPTPSAAANSRLGETRFNSGRIEAIHAPDGRIGPDAVAARSAELDMLMARYAQHYEIPEELVRRVAKRESTFNPTARNGPYWGLMQIRHDTAKGMGYQGSASGLLDAETNLKYAVRYLRGAWLVAKGNMAVADKLYQRGYYYDAKKAGLLDETGLGKDRRRRNPS